MGFGVNVITDILKFPNPHFTKYKNYVNFGMRNDVPPLKMDIELQIKFPKNIMYELLVIEFDFTGWKDSDSLSIFKNNSVVALNVFGKELPQRLLMRPVLKINPENEDLIIKLHNTTGTSKALLIDFGLTCNKKPPTLEQDQHFEISYNVLTNYT